MQEIARLFCVLFVVLKVIIKKYPQIRTHHVFLFHDKYWRKKELMRQNEISIKNQGCFTERVLK